MLYFVLQELNSMTQSYLLSLQDLFQVFGSEHALPGHFIITSHSLKRGKEFKNFQTQLLHETKVSFSFTKILETIQFILFYHL